MKFLTTQNVSEVNLMNQALTNEGLRPLSDHSEIHLLGEGAWHFAFLIEKEQLVLRIPKKVAYEKEVTFQQKELTAEYAATKAFYTHANRAKEGICPEFFTFFVQEELTYTLESYLGNSDKLGDLTPNESLQYGREIGDFFLSLETVESPYKGIGYLKCDQNGKLTGELDMDQKEFVIEETREYVEELNPLLASDYDFDKKRVEAVGRELISARSLNGEIITFTNQDTSPENLIFSKGGLKMLDPYPILSPGVSLAANHVFNYHYLFPSLHNTLRYREGNYLQSLPQLRANAEGFKEGYTADSRQKRYNLHIEVFLKLVTMTYTHYQLINEQSLSREQVIRYGTKAQIEERFDHFLKQLEQYPEW
ncbi:hypothetical protein [Bacillus sp. N1-1]|jgi:hypothetical protein|uniref:hypothetical protein n=1 Tax=Bacillus sp. N1-1 TaxID=2682541 RepID=UPI001315FECA|nr:hypothetical protein [Bacillus sp. N1-1]QHA90814.1 hypothetical protein GNK04_04855 [Bacillus sp. N1-1]